MIIYQSDQALNYPKQQIKTPLAGSAWQQLLQPEENISNLMLLAVKFNNTQTGSDCRHSERSSFSNVASVSRSTSAAATVHSRGVRHAARTRREVPTSGRPRCVWAASLPGFNGEVLPLAKCKQFSAFFPRFSARVAKGINKKSFFSSLGLALFDGV